MMSRRTGLGRGLDSLIPGGERPASIGIQSIPIEQILPNPHQPRKKYDSKEMEELAESIRSHGIIQPLIVTRGKEPDEFILIAGERRLLAARLVDLLRVPAIIREASEQQRLELALIENIQRTDLNPLEAAVAYNQLVDEFGLSHDDIAGQIGKSRSAVSNTIRLLKLSPAVKEALSDGKISEGHARNLLTLSSPQAQSAALQTILNRQLNVRQTEELVRRLSGEKPALKAVSEPPAEIRALEVRLEQILGTRVTINRRKKGGTLVIHYYSDEEINSILERLEGIRDNP